MSDKGVQDFLETVFGTGNRKPPTVTPKTTDQPDMKLFMLQVIYAYSRLATTDPMTWEKTFRNKGNGKEYTVTVHLRESV